jgi:hypothetical protein
VDAFHSDDTSENSQNLFNKSLGKLHYWSDREKAELYRDIDEAYDREILTEYTVNGLRTLYRMAELTDGGGVFSVNGEFKETSELERLKQIVDEHLESEIR